MTATSAATTAFRSTFFESGHADYASLDGRRLRYRILQAFAANDAYGRDWSTKYRIDHGLYAFTRSIGSVGYELAEFYVAHLHGGHVDAAAGDGEQVPSALPIVVPETNANADALRQALAALWRASRINKALHLLDRTGNICGDVGLEVVDDAERRKVYLRVVDPAVIADLDLDDWGNVKGYTRQEARPDPDRPSREVTYTEVVDRRGQNVRYRTYLNDQPYAWDEDNGEEWELPYGFVPLVMIQHIDVGDLWGWGELYAGLAKMREVDDLGSLLDDQIRKLVNSPWLFNFAKPTGRLSLRRSTAATTAAMPADTPSNPQAGREEMAALYIANEHARGQPLVAPMDLAAVNERLQRLDAAIERHYPELRFERLRASGDVSGIALRVARQPAETKVRQRRANYDDAIVRAQQMAVAIGGYRQYEGYGPFGLDSYAAGTLDHSIADRAVFATDPLDRLEEEKAFWEVTEIARRAGMPLAELLRATERYDDEDLARIEAAREMERETAAAAFGRAFDQGAE